MEHELMGQPLAEDKSVCVVLRDFKSFFDKIGHLGLRMKPLNL